MVYNQKCTRLLAVREKECTNTFYFTIIAKKYSKIKMCAHTLLKKVDLSKD